jgi:hypothetical protein
MIVREHCRGPNGRCIHCGAAPDYSGGYGERTCVPRDDGIDKSKLAPEPKRREPAHLDADAISARLVELQRDGEAARIAGWCAVKAGQPKDTCNQCGAGIACRVCAKTQGQPITSCLICGHKPSIPCP